MAPKGKKKSKVKKKSENECPVEDGETELRAMSTIERLSRKYLHKSPNASAHTRGTIDIPSPEEKISDTSICSEDSSKVKNRTKMFSLSNPVKKKPKRLARATVKRTCKETQASSKVLNVSNSTIPPAHINSPIIKVPRPTLGHSTPSTVTSKKDNSLFGFEDMQTPLGLSPVVSDFDEFGPSRSLTDSPQKSRVNVSFKDTSAVYSVPSQKARKRQTARKKAGICESEVKQWVSELNNQFDEVDKFELVVE